jgi:lactate dehydrogenase-like 2-hydroxyacid dehydrogenase
MPGLDSAPLPEGAELRVWEHDRDPTADELRELADGCDAVIGSGSDRYTAEFFAASPALRIVALVSAGFDGVDLDAAVEHGVVISHVPGVLAETTADLAVALMLMARRGLLAASDDLRAGRWVRSDPQQFLGLDVTGATLGIVGYGEIGQAMARRGVGLGMDVVQHSRRPRPADGVARAVELDELLRVADVVSLHVPQTPRTTGMIGARELDLMGPSSTLVNTARGGVVDQDALLAALREGRIHSAGLDVFASEPLSDPGHPLLHEPRAVCLPHVGSATSGTRRAMTHRAARNASAVLAGETAPNPVPRG